MTLQEIRQNYSQYSDMTDEQLAKSLHKKYYSDIPFKDFSQKIGYTQSQKIEWTPEMQEKYKAMNVPNKFLESAKGFGQGMWEGIGHGIERVANGATLGGYGWANRNLGGEYDKRKQKLNDIGLAGQIAGGATEFFGGILPFVATGGGSTVTQGTGTLAKLGSMANKVNYARPINAFAAGRTAIASNVPYLGKSLSGIESLARNGLVGAGMGTLGAGFESNFDPQDMKLGGSIGLGIGAAAPVISKGIGLTSQFGRDFSDKLSESIDKSWVQSFFKRTENQINAGIPKFAPRGMNNKELFGDMIRSEANTGLGKIKKTQEALYNRVYQNTNMKGKAVTDKTKNVIKELTDETTLQGKSYLEKIMKNLGGDVDNILEKLTPEQVKAYKTNNPKDYEVVLKSIVRHEMKANPSFKFAMNEGKRDYGHFLLDRQRQNYVHSMPNTLNNPDVHVSLDNDGVIKEYLIKKYKDPQVAKDLWDIIVKKDGTVVTKIPRSGKHGSNYAKNLIESGNNWGTRQSSTYSKAPLGQTASDAFQYALPNNNIPQKDLFVKPNILQLQSLKREIGKDMLRGEANFTKEQVGRIYDAIKNDVFKSVAKNAIPEKQDFVAKALAKADAYYKAQQMRQSPQSFLENFAKDNKQASGIASNFLRDLKAKSVNTKAVKSLFKKSDNPSLLKEEAMSHIRTRNDFNQLSPELKKIIYGDRLQVAEKLFNGVWGDRLGDRMDGIFDLIDKSEFIKKTSPFLSGSAGRLSN